MALIVNGGAHAEDGVPLFPAPSNILVTVHRSSQDEDAEGAASIEMDISDPEVEDVKSSDSAANAGAVVLCPLPKCPPSFETSCCAG